MGTHKTYMVFWVLIMAFLVTSCSGKGSAVIQDTTCKAPCWRNIEVGKTGIEPTIQLLKQMPDVDTYSIRRGRNPQTLVEAISAGFINDRETSLEITFQNDKVVSIYFSYAEDISLADAITKFGEPKYIYPSALQGDPTVYLTVEFLYPDLGICLHHQNKGLILKLPKTYEINGSANISEIYYVDPSLPQGQIKYGCLTGGNESDIDSNRVAWEGFADYLIPLDAGQRQEGTPNLVFTPIPTSSLAIADTPTPYPTSETGYTIQMPEELFQGMPRVEIGRRLISKWLDHFKTQDVTEFSRVRDYRIDKVFIDEHWQSCVEKTNVESITTIDIMVLPFVRHTIWLAGGGGEQGDWVTKQVVIVVYKVGDDYTFRLLGVPPCDPTTHEIRTADGTVVK